MKLAELTNEKWKAKYTEVHSREKPQMIGNMVMLHIWDIQELCQKHKPEMVMDYGCGKAFAYHGKKVHKMWETEMFLYDIGIPKYRKLPTEEEANKIGGIISCDVLEHIPEEFIDATFEYWYSLKPDFVYATIAQYPAIKKLDDGSNAHCTIKPASWWEEKMFKHMNCDTTILYYPTGNHYIKNNYIIRSVDEKENQEEAQV